MPWATAATVYRTALTLASFGVWFLTLNFTHATDRLLMTYVATWCSSIPCGQLRGIELSNTTTLPIAWAVAGGKAVDDHNHPRYVRESKTKTLKEHELISSTLQNGEFA